MTTTFDQVPKSFIREAVWMGIDQSLAHTGLCWENANSQIMSCVMPPPKGLAPVPRLRWFRTQMIDLLSQMPALRMVAIEGYSFGSKFSPQASLGELGGTLRILLYDAQVPSVIAAPTSVKKFLTGKGKGTKSAMIKEVYKVYGIDVDDDNEADAVVLCQIARGADTGLYSNVTRKEVLDSLTVLHPKSAPVARSRSRTVS